MIRTILKALGLCWHELETREYRYQAYAPHIPGIFEYKDTYKVCKHCGKMEILK